MFNWPDEKYIFNSTSAVANNVEKKLGIAIRRIEGAEDAKIGVLLPNYGRDKTQMPIAIVCKLPIKIHDISMAQIHKLAWNFGYSPLLITMEPHVIRSWTCYEPPKEPLKLSAEIKEASYDLNISLSEEASHALQWINLTTGRFFKEFNHRFNVETRIDRTLIKSLKYVRKKLHEKSKLDFDIIHSLLARIILIQFLFQRKDKDGISALDKKRLDEMTEKKILSSNYEKLSDILESKEDTYSLFNYLGKHFNGDLFQGKNESQWSKEKKKVYSEHLSLLAKFINGKLDAAQSLFWSIYEFDVIPLELISSIYEVFLRKENKEKKEKNSSGGLVYTPMHLVDFILDDLLPWEEDEWDIKILDPSCGSGIFLVKAYQRLIYRWKKAHPNTTTISSEALIKLLVNSLFGVDMKHEAVTVASFSLYLAMCDEIEPRDLWETTKFPTLLNNNLIVSDFFSEDTPGIHSVDNAGCYDIVLGNAPWGKGIEKNSNYVKKWSEKYEWPIHNGDYGPLFLAKSALLTKKRGNISIIQPCSMLTNTNAAKFRKIFFDTYKVREIVNLSVMRFVLFPKATAPACIVNFSIEKPDNRPFFYITPKLNHSSEDNCRIIIEQQDINRIYPQEAVKDPLIWSVLMWGGRRDFNLINKLKKTSFNLFDTIEKRNHHRGIPIPKKKAKRIFSLSSDIQSRALLNGPNFPDNVFIYLSSENNDIGKAGELNSNDNISDFSAFTSPQLIIKLSWTVKQSRFKAAIVPKTEKEGILCSAAFVSVHFDENNVYLSESAWLSYNSKLAVYFFMLSSGRMAGYRPSVTAGDLLKLPCPRIFADEAILENIKDYDEIDNKIYELFEFNDPEKILIEDLFDYTLPDFKSKKNKSGPGYQSTPRRRELSTKGSLSRDDTIYLYCDYFLRGLKAGFGGDRKISITIFEEPPNSSKYLPLRLIAVKFNHVSEEVIQYESIDSENLLSELERINQIFLNDNERRTGIFYRRTVRVYDIKAVNGKKVPTLYIIKPDYIRCWLRSVALRDSDEVYADMKTW